MNKKFLLRCENFIKKALGVEFLTEEQLQVLYSIEANKRTLVKSGHSVGKTFIAAAIALCFLVTRKNSIVITTAPTKRQVEDLLWQEIRQLHSNAKVLLTERDPLTSRLDVADKWFAIGISPKVGKEEESAVRFQGYHAKDILVILDEACGIHPAIWEAIDGVLSNKGARALAIGNPSVRSSEFFRNSQKPSWNVLKISSINHPNVIEDKEIVAGAVSREWIEEKITEWCEPIPNAQPTAFQYGGQWYLPNNLFMWKVLGEFPETDENTLFTDEIIGVAFTNKPNEIGNVYFGQDVARFGEDSNELCQIKGNVASFYSWSKKDIVYTADKLRKYMIVYKPDVTVVDTDGVGGGVFDILKKHKRKGVYAFHGSGSPLKRIAGKRTELKFGNLRAQAYYQLSRDIKKLSITPDEKLKEELLATDMFIKNGKIYVIPKDDIKEILGRSPDKADALAYANFGKYVKREIKAYKRI